MGQHYFWSELSSQRGWLGVSTKFTNQTMHTETVKQVDVYLDISSILPNYLLLRCKLPVIVP